MKTLKIFRYLVNEGEIRSITEAVSKQKQYLTGRRFSQINDQKSVSYMFNIKHSGKNKMIKLFAGKLNSALMTLILFTDVVKKRFPLILYLNKVD